jgi:hypothetical protein
MQWHKAHDVPIPDGFPVSVFLPFCIFYYKNADFFQAKKKFKRKSRKIQRNYRKRTAMRFVIKGAVT